MRCQICDTMDAVLFDDRDGAYICEKCSDIVADTLLDFVDPEEDCDEPMKKNYERRADGKKTNTDS